MQQYLPTIGRIPAIINLDPANDELPYSCDVNICDLPGLKEIINNEKIGPNEALIQAMKYIDEELEWLIERLKSMDDSSYFIFDLPGQVELSICDESLKNIITKLQKRHFRLTVVHLCDAAHCCDPFRYISMLIVALQSMIHLEAPQINVLSKLDLMNSYGELPFRLEYYLNVMDLHYLLSIMNVTSLMGKKLFRLSESLAEVIEDIGMLSFVPLAIEDRDCMAFLLGEVDKSNGYVFGGLIAGNDSIIGSAQSDAHRERLIELITERYSVPFKDTD